MMMQHFRVKIFAEAGPGFRLADAIPVFHRWIQNNALPELLVDVADYAHVPAGPGVVLIGHDSHYALDESGHRLGLLYTRRTAADGSVQDRIDQALRAARHACELLEKEPEYSGGKLRFHRNEFEVSVNDRALAPSTAAGFAALRPDLSAVLDRQLGAGSYSLEMVSSARQLLTAAVRPRF
jgi:hypothetical protein